MKVVVCGGHATPALALAEYLTKHYRAQVYFLAAKSSFERRAIPSWEITVLGKRKDIQIVPLTAGRFQRRLSPFLFVSLWRSLIGFLQSLLFLLRVKPDVVVSFGSFLSVPPVVAAWILGIPIVTHEQTPVLTLANRINACFAQKIAISFPQTKQYLPSDKVVLTGLPVRQEIKTPRCPPQWKETPLCQKKGRLIFITGGKSGSVFLNQLTLKLLKWLTKKAVVVHQTGALEFEVFKKQKANFDNYYPFAYLDSAQMGWILKRADLVISRAGANITWELAFLGKKAILIPLPISPQQEQQKNAFWLKSLGLGEVVPQEKATPQLIKKMIVSMLKKEPPKKKRVLPDGTAKLAELAVGLISKEK